MKLLQGDAIEQLRQLPNGCVQTCVTSPPYYGLRDYGHDGQIGLEQTPDAYISKLVGVFREVRRVLKDDGTLWLNLGDSYSGSNQGAGTKNPTEKQASNRGTNYQTTEGHKSKLAHVDGFKPKDLLMIPARVALALQADGWYLRSEIIWHKPNPMPESVKDRPTKSHEMIYLLAKSQKYFYDADAVREPHTTTDKRKARIEAYREGVTKHDKAIGRIGNLAYKDPLHFKAYHPNGRNRRDVWTVTTKPYKGAHFATFPPDLIEPCILAGSRIGDTVLDPFNGSGTTGEVSIKHGRDYIGVELNPEYIKLSEARFDKIRSKMTERMF